MGSLTLVLPDEVRLALLKMAEREFRRPRDQAAKLLTEALRQAGALTGDGAPSGEETADAGVAR